MSVVMTMTVVMMSGKADENRDDSDDENDGDASEGR